MSKKEQLIKEIEEISDKEILLKIQEIIIKNLKITDQDDNEKKSSERGKR